MRNKYGKCTEFFTFTIRTYTHTNVCEQKQSQIAYIFCTICGDISFFSGSPRWVHAKSLQSCLTLCDPMDVAHQAPLSMRFSRQEQRSGLPCPPPGDLPNPGIKPRPLTLQASSLPSEPSGKPKNTGVGSLSLLQGICPTQESNWGLLHCRWIFTSWNTREAQSAIAHHKIKTLKKNSNNGRLSLKNRWFWKEW